MARDLLMLKGLVKAKPMVIFKNSEKCFLFRQGVYDWHRKL